MREKITFIISLISLAGCTSLPPLPDDRPGDIVQLSDLIECQILTAFKTHSKHRVQSFDDWSANYTITQNTTDTAGAGFDPVQWIAPSGVDKLVVVGDASTSREVYRWGRAEFSVRVKNPKSQACERSARYKDIRVSPSDFRLGEWVEQLGRAENQLTSMGYTVRVTITSKAGVGSDFANKKWTAVGGFHGSRETVRNVDFTFSPIPAAPKPTKVIVVAPIPSGGSARPLESEKLKPLSNPIRPRSNQMKLPRESQPSVTVPDAAVRQNRDIQQLQRLDQLPDF